MDEVYTAGGAGYIRILPPSRRTPIAPLAMRRFILVVIVAALALANPTVRSYLQPYLKFALDPVYEWSARSRVKAIARMIEAERTVGRPIPTPRTFGAFLEERLPGDHGAQDPWGVPYYLLRERRSLVVGSAGRDREAGTADDIRVAVGGGR